MIQPVMDAKILDLKALSAELGLSQGVLRQLYKKRRIPFLRLGHRTLRFQAEKVREALRQFEVEAGA
jgi:excisionase family DNA binding protein